jgi:hypothetical protein
LNIAFLQRLNNDNADAEPEEPEDREHVEALERLHREKNAYILTLDYHFETGFWNPLKNTANKDALDKFTAAVRALI